MTSYLQLRDYQMHAKTTAIFPGRGKAEGIMYAALGLNGEAGEAAEQVKKMVRDDHGILTEERRMRLKKELGDVLWYLSTLATEAELSLEDIAEENLRKLAKRSHEQKISGDGSDR